MKTTTQKIPTPTAEALVSAAEKIELGADIAADARAAEEASAAQRAQAIAALFPHALSTDSGAWAGFSFYLDHTPPGPGYGLTLAAVHLEALAVQPELARLIRSVEARNVCARMAGPGAHDAMAMFDSAIARALVEADHELAPTARALLEADQLADRIEAVKARHAAHLEEVERERVAAELEEKTAALRELEAAVSKIENTPFTQAQAGEREFKMRNARNALLAGRLRASGVPTLRIGLGSHDAAQVAQVADAAGWGLVQVDVFEGALAAAQAGEP